ncbi:sigma-70 family RNA polymerase sigma factor [Pseudothauera rhizosphaerae]|uniref:Sigma-70 family RNA polymerase sigma factor n=1 Tax=Pseudothauera rhizosphaerae TaxID=2565932 RepID=A0A4S4AMA0_9RHOO|nr:sigma-70 family RNA polymerase sigma factor [Pseudothauera rhizosphaerae]THF60709.1 sigma-70 family RNA polymerase sigma factor [Pseudothauera rhizosphaerae]
MSDPTASFEQTAHALYHDHHRWLQNWLYRRIGCPHQAADLTQDTFVRVLGARDLGRLDEPRAFLTTLAQRVLFSFWRRRNLENAWLEALAQQPENHAPSAEDYALVREAIETLDRLLGGLPLRARKAFLMNRLEEMTHAEIARALGVSVATVERDVKRAFTHCYLACLDAMPQGAVNSLTAPRP